MTNGIATTNGHTPSWAILPCHTVDENGRVVAIDATLRILAGLEGDVSENKATAIAGESRKHDLRRTRLVESGNERFGNIAEQMADIRSRQEWAASLTGIDRALAFKSIDADMAAVDRQLERLADDEYLPFSRPLANRSTKLIEGTTDLDSTQLGNFAQSLR